MRRLIMTAMALVLLLAACAGGDAAMEVVGEGLDGGGFGIIQQAADQPGTDDSGDGETERTAANFNLDILPADRKVIRNASLQLASDDTTETYDEIVRIAERLGGFVEYAQVSPTNDEEHPYIQVTVRVPSEEFTEALTSFKNASDEVISESQGAEDVTETFVDLEAQLTNLTALEVELRALLEEVRKQPDADPEKLLRVFTEISNTRGQIERIQGQLNYLEDAVGLATANISIEPTPQAVPIVEEGWAPGETVRDATRTLVNGLQDLGDTVIRFGIAVLPLLILLIGVPAVVLLVAYRWWRTRRGTSVRLPEPVASE